MNAEKESNPKKAAHKKEQKQAVILPLSLRETENANSQTQDPNIQERPASVENSSPTSGNESIPAVHGSSPAYSDGAEQKYQQLQTSLEKTGELDHPDTKQKEMEYKSTLGISELREYHDAKPAEAKPAAAAQADKKEELVPVATAAGTSSTDAPLKSPAIVDKGEVVNAESLEPVADKEEVPEAEDATPKTATANPVFLEMQDQITTTAKAQRKHGPAGKASQDAQAAAPSPSNERQSKAQAGQVKKMSEQEPGTFSAAAFKAELKKKIAGMQLPKNEEQADNFEKNNNIKQVNEQAMGSVKKEKNAASGSIANTTSQKPDTGAQPVRNVAKMPTPDHGKAPSAINASKAMPSKRDAANIEKPIQSETDSIDNQMKEHGVTDSMLANSNEPSFKGALDEKNKAKEQSKAATNQFRTEEGQQINKTQNEAQAQAAQQISGMHGTRKGGLDKVLGNQQQTASKDTEKRKEIADKINKIYGDTKKDVDDILNGLDDTVAGKFAAGSKAAKIAFENHVDKEMTAYKKKRYGDSWLDWRNLKRVKDAVVGLPPEVNEFFTSGKEVYIKTMDVYIDNIANVVASQLNAAKRRIATGKKEVQNYVDTLSPSLKKLGAAAISEIQGKFNALEKDVDSKKDALIDVLAKKYVENIEAVDARIKALKELNGGLVGMALKALSGVFAFIIEVKNTLMSLLAKVVEVVGAIIMDPIGFFGNLIAGVGQGFSNFTTNIWTHLKTGFFSWLTGASKGITITMPEDIFSLKGIFSITMQVLSLGWEGIRSIGATVVGEPLMKVLETGVEIVQVVRKDGIAGLWEYLKDQFQDLKETVMDAIMDIIQNQVIQAGIKWILGLLSPVGAFVKAIMAIIDVVKFFVQRAAQIAELIKAFMDSVAAIASGKVGAVAVAIENALAKAIPVLIGLLASILGISGLADKVLAVIRKIRQRIVAGITKFWNFVKEKGKGLLNKVGIGSKRDDKKKDDKKKDKKEPSKSNTDTIESWDDVVPFKNVENVDHTLYFRGEGENAKLYMHSKDDHVLKHLDNAESEAKTPAEKKAVSDGVNYYNGSVLPSNNALWKLEKDRKRLLDNNKDGKNDSKIKANEEAIKKQNITQDNVLNKLAQLFKMIKFDDGVEPTTVKTMVTFEQDSMGRASKVEAKPLTWMAGNTKGSSPYQDPLGWDYTKGDIRENIYIRGHLLNDNIHGPGVKWNLVPITRVMNSGMEKDAEREGKKVLEEKNRIMGYKTTVNSYYDVKNDERDQYFPQQITVEWGEYKNSEGLYDAKGTLVDVKRAVFTQGRPAMPYNINDLGETLLVDKLKLNANFAKAVAIVRNDKGAFKDMANFRLRMKQYYSLNRVSKDAEREEGVVAVDAMRKTTPEFITFDFK
ncbi:DNA/RNA non-specific endonuclease [Flavobacterium inviolabile]|uniref:DNA/RNA non-specific endonuclease n=1 Tax=Flavobacterium inviolabile TaxID=2748320 RepID=UPI0015AD6AA7|nr:DNA/RNA non-specific endonuclease [Flavobacterium inviolabile]